LKALAELDYPHFDVLVVDNAPSDDQGRQVAMRWGARYALEPTVGLSRARNRGARASSSEIVAFLDDDCLPEAEWLRSLAAPFIDPLVMVVTGRIVASDVDQWGPLLTPMSGSGADGHPESVFDHETPFWFERANFGGIGDGGNMAFRRRVFDIWPGFDERLGRGAVIDGGEEHFAFFSLLQCGFRIAYSPDAVVSHPFPLDVRELRRRNLRLMTTAAGYITLLFVEEPRHRRALVKFVLEGLRGTPRGWRNSAGQSCPIVVSLPRRLLAWLCGPLLYARARFEWRQVAPSRFPLNRLVPRENKAVELFVDEV